MSGKLFVVSVGPGCRDGLTIKAKEAIKKSDIVIVPKSQKSKRSVAFEAAGYILKDKHVEMFNFPTTNDEAQLEKAYSEEAKKIKAYIDEGRIVSFLTIGDASIYSTFSYLAKKLRDSDVDYEAIAGIPSFIEFVSRIKVPLTTKNQSFCVVELKKGVDFIVNLFEFFETVVVMKVNNRLDLLYEIIDKINPQIAILGSNICLEDEKIVDLLNTDSSKLKEAYLSVAVLKR
ncbi:precorrin-2 C(20)-methyltransferase [Hippea jasoniae]|uniref:precorrin-2 C(20)-methyltransferase n=1 Tax=Hippea jasoniae TaxID=944479 RepID=UPI0005532F4A|nr:precorrin-2 C(20)-methyltransferase [Hippea jasoniae]